MGLRSAAAILGLWGAAMVSPAACQEGKRLFGIIPNHGTSPVLEKYKPLSANEKLRIATRDALDPGTFVVAGALAGEGQLAHSTPVFEQGLAGYGRYYGAALADQVVADYMSEAVFPILLHQDPRYFRRGTGRAWSRLGYAVSRLFRTENDSGRAAFNYSALGGTAAAVALSNAYYPGGRTLGNNVARFGLQIGVGMGSNVLKEFYPDLVQALHKKH